MRLRPQDAARSPRTTGSPDTRAGISVRAVTGADPDAGHEAQLGPERGRSREQQGRPLHGRPHRAPEWRSQARSLVLRQALRPRHQRPQTPARKNTLVRPGRPGHDTVLDHITVTEKTGLVDFDTTLFEQTPPKNYKSDMTPVPAAASPIVLPPPSNATPTPVDLGPALIGQSANAVGRSFSDLPTWVGCPTGPPAYPTTEQRPPS